MSPFDRLPAPVDDLFDNDVTYDPQAGTWTRKD